MRVTSYPPISRGKQIPKTNEVVFTKVQSLEPPYPDIQRLVEHGGQKLPASSVSGDHWQLEQRQPLGSSSASSVISLGDLVGQKIFYGIKTGLNKVFVIDEQVRSTLIWADVKSKELIMPFATGKDIDRWRLGKTESWLLYMSWDVDIKGLSRNNCFNFLVGAYSSSLHGTFLSEVGVQPFADRTP